MKNVLIAMNAASASAMYFPRVEYVNICVRVIPVILADFELACRMARTVYGLLAWRSQGRI